ncbi:MAG: hypothetical protein IAE66_04870 [Xanthomonadaceae bacterium]|nr:hypothetical protein [Xanthomonadaceae bacterium]
MIIKRIDPMSVAKITGIIAAVFGLIIGVLFFLFGAMFSALPGVHGNGMAMGLFGGFMGVLLLPILYGVCGFLGGLIHAWVYNVAAGWVGGVRIEVE